MKSSKKNIPSAVVGLDIGHDTIKVTEARYSKDGISITGMGIARTPEGVIDNELIVDPKTLGQAIKTLLNESGIKTKACVSSVAGQSKVVVRIIEVPRMGDNELVETMKWEAEKLGFSASDSVMDFQVLEKEGGSPNAQTMDVLLAVAQRELIDGHVQAVLAAGLKPIAIDIEPLATGRSAILAAGYGVSGDITAIINIGANNTDMGIYEDGMLTFPSPPLGIAGINFTREIAEALGETLEQAEITKKEYARVDLSAFFDIGSSQQAQPESFHTSIPFETPFDRPLNIGEGQEEQPVQEPEAKTVYDFQETADGPVFDLGGGPAFDLGSADGNVQPEADANAGEEPFSSGPVFDLGDDFGGESAAGGPTFDLGGEVEPEQTVSVPTFDLDEIPDIASESSETVTPPSFDLSDVDENAVSSEPVPIDEGTNALASVAPKSSDLMSLNEQRVSEAISGVLMDLASELRRSLDYYSIKYSKAPARIILCGGTAKMPNLDAYLSHELGVPVEVADPLKNLNVNVPAMSDQYLKEISPLFTVSVGLAIRDMIE